MTGQSGSERGLSEVLAFVLVFGIILSSVAILAVFGFSAMDGYQEHEQLQNAERAMGALAENFNDLLRADGLDSRTSDLALRDGTIVTGSEGTELNVTINDTAIGETDPFTELSDDEWLSLGELRYEAGGETIGYESGAVLRSDTDGARSVAREQPHIRCVDRTDTAIVSLLLIDAPDRSFGSDETTQFDLRVDNRTTGSFEDLENGLELSVGGDDRYHEAWTDDILEPRTDCLETADTAVVTVVEADLTF